MAYVFLTVMALSVSTMASFEMMTGAMNSCLVSDHRVKCWGHNYFGQLGLEDDEKRLRPTVGFIDLGTDRTGDVFEVDSVELGNCYFCALSSDKSVKCLGDCQNMGCFNTGADDNNQLGDAVGEIGDGIPIVASFHSVVQMASLDSMVCVLADVEDSGRFVECVGWDFGDKIWAVDDDTSDWDVAYDEWVDDGAYGAPVVTTAEDDKARLDLSQLGLSWPATGLGGGFYTICVFNSGTQGALKCWGEVTVDEGLTSSLFIESVYCGKDHCCAKSIAGQLVCWGSDSSGQSDISELPFASKDGIVFVQDYAVTRFTTCALSTNRVVACIGSNNGGQLAGGSFTVHSGFSTEGVRLAHGRATDAHLCIYESDGSKAQCWGHGDSGQLGYGGTSGSDSNGQRFWVDLFPTTTSEHPTSTPTASPTASPSEQPTSTPTASPTASPSEQPTYTTPQEPGHLVVRGNPNNPKFPPESPDYYCQPRDKSLSKYATNHNWFKNRGQEKMLAIRCCNGNGNGWSPKTSSAFPMTTDCFDSGYDYAEGATFEQAEAVCANRGGGYRLCTYDEAYVQKDAKGTGCRYDAVYHWVSNTCDVEVDDSAHNAMVNERAETGSMTVEESSSGNEAANLTATITVIGAAVGTVLIVAAVAMFLRRRKADIHFEAGAAERVADVSSSDIAVTVEMDKVTAGTVDIGDEHVVTTETPAVSVSAIETEGTGVVEMVR